MQRAEKSAFAVAFVSRYQAGCAWRKSLSPCSNRAAQHSADSVRRPTLTLSGPRREPATAISARAGR
jgi:hypothetical protein